MADELLRYRSQFPILERTTYLISNSLGAMPQGVYDAMKGYADIWATRGVRAWEERWWMLAAASGRRDWRADERPARFGFDSSERHHLPGGRGFVLRFLRQAQQGGVQRPELSVGDVFLGGATGIRRARAHGSDRRRDHRSPRAPAGRDRRADLAGPGLARDLSKRLHSGCESDHRESSQGRRPCCARHFSIAGHGAGRCAGARCRLCLWRGFEVAVWRPGRRLICMCVPTWGESCSQNSPAGLLTRIHSASKSDPRVKPIRRFAS